MELLRAWGLEDALRAGGNEVEWVLWRSETLARADEGEGFEVGLPTREQSALVSPTCPACAPQDHLERVLLDHLRASDDVEVALGTELVAIDVRREGAGATLRDVRTGASGSCTPATSSPPTAPAAACARRSASPCTGPSA